MKSAPPDAASGSSGSTMSRSRGSADPQPMGHTVCFGFGKGLALSKSEPKLNISMSEASLRSLPDEKNEHYHATSECVPPMAPKVDWSTGPAVAGACSRGPPSGGFQRHASNPRVGNAGFYYANFGKRANDKPTQYAIDAQLKRNPAHMLFISEMPAETERILKLPPDQASLSRQPTDDAAVDAFYNRTEFEWVTCRQDDTSGDPCCIAVRKEHTNPPHLTTLEDCNLQYGQLRNKGKTQYPVTRILVCKAHFSDKAPIGYMGHEVVGICMHLHYAAAKNHSGFVQARISIFDTLAELAKKHGAVILAADANMSLCTVPQELRSRGVPCVTVACYPWRSGVSRMTPHLDSCGIWVINIEPVEPKLCFSLSQIKDGDDMEAWMPKDEKEEEDEERQLAYWPANTGPGKPVKAYLSKTSTLQEKFKALMETPWATREDLVTAAHERDAKACNSGTAVAVRNEQLTDPAAVTWLRTKEKRLEGNVWAIGGRLHPGSHFPLAVFTDNTGRRSQQSYDGRKAQTRAQQRAKKKSNSDKQGDEPLPDTLQDVQGKQTRQEQEVKQGWQGRQWNSGKGGKKWSCI